MVIDVVPPILGAVDAVAGGFQDVGEWQKLNYSFQKMELPDGSPEGTTELIDLFMQAGAVEPWPDVFNDEMSFLKEVGFINVVQVPPK